MIKTISVLILPALLFLQCDGARNMMFKANVDTAWYSKYVTGARGDRGINFVFELKKVPANYILQKLQVNGVDLEYSYNRKSDRVRIEANKVYSIEKLEGEKIIVHEERNLYSDEEFAAELTFFDTVNSDYDTITIKQLSQKETIYYP